MKKCWKLKNYFEANGKNTERSPFFFVCFFLRLSAGRQAFHAADAKQMHSFFGAWFFNLVNRHG
ncbi:hypothetical protein B4099_2682 [Heyndrickxia coagulans]|uniref:Uncharacterized protein n=1 Tax=Heyndrickxia coagulans TaxID=1398 RepID=A0A150K021_HEYCO|nr:hypothetical protein B4099_2682 [Heyndrickxia coagulans]